jgi:CRISPR-associated protein Cas6
MRLEEESAAPEQAVPGDIVDVVFAISCRSLPVDHAYALSQAIEAALPWFAHEPGVGLHPVHGAASASGWMRPEGAGALLQLSHRAKLALRLPRHRLDDAAALLGRTLEVAGWPLRVDRLSLRPLSRITTLYSRCVVLAATGGEHSFMAAAAGDEPAFLVAAAGELGALGINPGTMLCGRVTPVATPARTYHTRSLMVAGLTPEQSLALQQHGLGDERKLGCGVFIPHKDIGDLNSRSD